MEPVLLNLCKKYSLRKEDVECCWNLLGRSVNLTRIAIEDCIGWKIDPIEWIKENYHKL